MQSSKLGAEIYKPQDVRLDHIPEIIYGQFDTVS
jgi:hypothetical protein